jgi:copper(I)-binding protein
MTPRIFRPLALAGLAVLAAGASAPVGPIAVRDAWTRPGAAGMNAAGYLTIVNRGAVPDRLLSATSGAAARVTLHQSRQVGTVMTMVDVPALTIPPHGAVNLSPGGYHLMLEHLTRPLRLGDQAAVVLVFQRAGAIRARLAVSPVAPAMAGMKM